MTGLLKDVKAMCLQGNMFLGESVEVFCGCQENQVAVHSLKM